ncbi:MAG: hypothetical protein K6T85_10450 [Gorillibacterium sp.]|nr:hypothetical protein [Gorillibacterium sp.]
MDSRRSAVATNTLLALTYRTRADELKETYPRVIILLSEHFIGMEEGLAVIRLLQGQKLRLQLWAEQALLHSYPLAELVGKGGIDDIVWPEKSLADRPSGDQSEQQLNQCCEADSLFIPVLSLALLSRIAQLDSSHPFVKQILLALCAGKPVGALTLSVEPEHFLWAEHGLSHASPFLKAEIRGLLEKVRGYGIQFLEPDKVIDWLSPTRSSHHLKKQVVTAEDILQASKLGRSSIHIQPQAIVTPLAADLARQYKIQLTSTFT